MSKPKVRTIEVTVEAQNADHYIYRLGKVKYDQQIGTLFEGSGVPDVFGDIPDGETRNFKLTIEELP